MRTASDRTGLGADLGLAILALLSIHALALALTRPPADAMLLAWLLPLAFVVARCLGTRRDVLAATLAWLAFPALVPLWLAGAHTLATGVSVAALAVRWWSLYPASSPRLQRMSFLTLAILASLAPLHARVDLSLSLRSDAVLFRGERALSRDSTPLTVSVAGPIPGVVLLSAAANVGGLSDGTPIAELRSHGRVLKAIVLGEHTAEWSWDRADLAGRQGHRRAPVFATRGARDERGKSFPARVYGAALRFTSAVDAGELELVVTAEPPAVLVVHELRTLRW